MDKETFRFPAVTTSAFRRPAITVSSFSFLQRGGHAEDHLSADHRRRAPIFHVPGDGQPDAVSVQAAVHVHVQQRPRRLQESRVHGGGVHAGLETVVPVPGVPGRRGIGERA